MNYIKFVILVYTFFTLIDSSKEDFYAPDDNEKAYEVEDFINGYLDQAEIHMEALVMVVL